MLTTLRLLALMLASASGLTISTAPRVYQTSSDVFTREVTPTIEPKLLAKFKAQMEKEVLRLVRQPTNRANQEFTEFCGSYASRANARCAHHLSTMASLDNRIPGLSGF